MGHPFEKFRQNKVEHSRVAHITKGYASGGAVHGDEAEDKALIKKTVKKVALRATGGSVKARADRPQRASGGRVKPVNVNVIVAPQGGKDQDQGLAGAPPMMPPPGPPPGGPPMPPPGAGGPPPGGPPMPPPGMHSSGGRAYASGGSVFAEGKRLGTKAKHDPEKGTEKSNLGRGKPVTYQTGGKVRATPIIDEMEKAAELSSVIATGGASARIADESRKGRNRRNERVKETNEREASGESMYARGGPINAGKGMGPKFEGGARGGKARLQKEKRAAKSYHKPIKRVGI